MSRVKPFVLVSCLALGVTPLTVGCTADASSSDAADESDVVTASDAKLKSELTALLQGLHTGGGEGDPDPYKVMDYKPKRGEAFNDALLFARLLPRMIPMDGQMVAGLQERAIADEWNDLSTGDPDAENEDRSAPAKWRKVKAFFDKNLKNTRSVVLGWAHDEGGSIETGAVAQVIVGQTASGRVIAIWGIDIWT